MLGEKFMKKIIFTLILGFCIPNSINATDAVFTDEKYGKVQAELTEKHLKAMELVKAHLQEEANDELVKAIKAGDLEYVQKIGSSDDAYRLDITLHFCKNAKHYAIAAGSLEIVKYLAAQGIKFYPHDYEKLSDESDIKKFLVGHAFGICTIL